MVDLHKKEHAFGAFTIGVAVGVGAALLFGTEDGRKIAQKLFDSLPDKIKNLKDISVDNNSPLSVIPGTDPESIPNSLISSPESTPHTYIANNS